MSIPFLTLPRELRDMIYRQLLSTKYTKVMTCRPTDSLKYEYEYKFHPSILRANKQIEREARNVLYNEDLFVRINTSGPMLSSDLFTCGRIGPGFTRLEAHGYAKEFAHHVMEVSLLRENVTIDDDIFDPSESHCFIVTIDELPRFCMKLLKNSADKKDELSIEIIAKNAAKGNTRVTATRLADSNTMSPLIQRLLEPFRSLHSLETVHIQGPIDNQYKTDLIASMCGPGPSEEQLFDRVSTAYEDALTTYDAGHTSSAITKLKKANDTMEDCKRLSKIAQYDPDAEPWITCKELQFNIWHSLAWATLENRTCRADVEAASNHVENLFQWYTKHEWYWPTIQAQGHDMAMLFYLLAEVNDALYNLGRKIFDRRSDELGSIVKILEQGLEYDPGNNLLEQQLRKKQEEKRNAEDMEDVMEIHDHIHEQGSYADEGASKVEGEVEGEEDW